jgi:hypothetical protein
MGRGKLARQARKAQDTEPTWRFEGGPFSEFRGGRGRARSSVEAPPRNAPQTPCVYGRVSGPADREAGGRRCPGHRPQGADGIKYPLLESISRESSCQRGGHLSRFAPVRADTAGQDQNVPDLPRAALTGPYQTSAATGIDDRVRAVTAGGPAGAEVILVGAFGCMGYGALRGRRRRCRTSL